MTLIVDRIEENFLVVELPNGKFVNIPREIAPTAKEGDVFIKETDKLVGEWMTFQQLYDNYSKFENWSKYLIDFFLENNK